MLPWSQLDTGGDPFVSEAFLGAIERLNDGQDLPALRWEPAHIALKDSAGKLAAALPLFHREHSFGDFSRDWGWAAAWQQAGLAYYPKLVSGVPYTPSPGPRLLVRPGLDHADWSTQLVAAAIETTRHSGASSWQCLFVEDRDRAVLRDAGCLLRRGVQFHWTNRGWQDFDHFLSVFRSEKRKKLKRERRAVSEAGLRLAIHHGHELDTELWAALHPMYADTFVRHGNHAALPLSFFTEVSAALGRRMVVFSAWRDETPVACAICYRDAHTLYGRHWGCRETVPGLHFELCYYQGIEYCLREGLSRFEPGAQGEHKLARGFEPTDTWCAYWIADPRLRRAVADYLAREAVTMQAYAEETAQHLPFRAG